MGLDFDAVEYCKNIKQRQPQPPYACPVDKCDRSYKTITGLQYHLVNFDHDNPQPLTPILTPNRKKARSRGAHLAAPKTPKPGDVEHGVKSGKAKQLLNPESLVTYNDDDETVQFNIDGKSVRMGANEPLPFVDEQQFCELVSRGLILNPDAPPLEENASWSRCEVPQAHYRDIPDYNVPDAPARPLAYYRFIEKSAEELDGEVEYDVDEEDTAWLEWMNEQREQAGLNTVSIDSMELLMDRLEKESFFQAAANGTSTAAEVDDDAVCCICMDGECQNTNVILFCDMCNLAVHQDCYGVPYIPEGQWLCRRCLQSPSTPVSCVLCPNAGGAFKQTDRGQWAHVVCALWIPEVRFANTVFLEPIDSIETIPAARWRLTCYVCKEKGLGACIQCHRNSCYAAFHVTCAQQAGLYMTMDTVNDGHNDSSVHVQKYAYCHAHTPADAKLKTNQKEVEDTRHKMKEARKALAKKRSSAPVVLIPTIPADRVQDIASMVHMQKKSQFLERLIAYWTLKRQFRNGVPLLRRLQSQGNHHGVIHRNGIEGAPDTAELFRQLKYWQGLRQDLERARLLCELVRKREKLKATYVKLYEQEIKLKLNPLESALSKLLDTLEARDTADIFREPVDTNEVPDYCDIVKHPMDLGTMREKLRRNDYSTLEQLEVDFDLMIQNCLAYNNKDTVFYRAGIRMRDQAAPLFIQLRKELQREGLLQLTQQEQRDHVEAEVEQELKQLLAAPPSEHIVQKLLILADKSQVLKDPAYRTKKIKQIRMEITRMRKHMQKERMAARHAVMRAHSYTDDEREESEQNVRKRTKHDLIHTNTAPKKPMRARRLTVCGLPSEFMNRTMNTDFSATDGATDATVETNDQAQTPPCSPLKSLNNSASPVGVNRRTAVLFTRKAQAALKRPSDGNLLCTPVKEELSAVTCNTTTTAAAAAATTLSVMSNINNNNLTSNLANNTSSLNITTSTNSNMLGTASNLAHKLSLNSSAALNNNALGLSAALNNEPSTTKYNKRNARHKRLSEMRHSASLSPKKSPTTSVTNTSNAANELHYNRIPDSFRVYRANNERDASESDDDNMSGITGSPCSSCSGVSMSGTGSEYDSSDADDDDEEDDEDDDDDYEQDDRGSNADHSLTQDVEMRDITATGNGATMSCSDSQASSSDDNEVLARKAKQRINGSDSTHKLAQRTPTPTQQLRAWKRGRKKQRCGTPNSRGSPTHKNATSNSKKSRARSNGREQRPNKLNHHKKQRGRSLTHSKHHHEEHEEDNYQGSDEPLSKSAQLLKPPLEPLQLVWAKCRGYPWYPALILDPSTPKGFVYNGVPLPAPPQDVLALRKNYPEHELFLVLFFDVKRTWQWLPANKLEILGIDKQVDQQKLVESRKPTERKAVKKAYQDALHYQSQVSDLEGQGPDPIM